MPWPSTTEFTDAIQSPSVSFRDNPELATGRVALYDRGGRAGMPVVATGQFACVYKVTTGNREIAVRCFTREVKDQRLRYEWLHEYLDTALPDSFVRFQYLEHGILVRGQWYPIVRMDWASGEPLNRFVQNNLDNSEAIAEVARRWRGAVGSLRGLGIAHNDLQHGNIMVQADNRLHFVDYDGIFLPRFLGERSPETGHKNYQHPQRSADDYDDRIDNFPALVVYLSLLALRSDQGLWDRFNNDDNLLLTQHDYSSPGDSECLQILKQSSDEQVRNLAGKLEEYCSLPVERVPDLESILRGVPAAPFTPPVPPDVRGTEPGTSAPGGYRGVLQNQDRGVPSPGPQPQPATASTSNLVKCPKCGRNNDQGLIYCVNRDCIELLSLATKNCGTCRKSIPHNSRYCIWCGQSQNQSNVTAHTGARQPADRAATSASSTPAAPSTRKACPNCRAQMSEIAIYCTRCGTVMI